MFTHVPAVRSTGPATDNFENVQAFIDVIDRHEVDYVISSHYHGYNRTRQKDTIYLVTGGGGAPLDEKERFGDLYHAIVFTVDRGCVSERIVLAQHGAGVGDTMKHFAMAKLSPFFIRHPAMTVVENLIILGMFCVFLNILIRKESWN
ncbi:hypothetical protein ACFL3Q_02875 [Planctomycetota bacterium]